MRCNKNLRQTLLIVKFIENYFLFKAITDDIIFLAQLY